MRVVESVRAGSVCRGKRAACSWLFLQTFLLEEDQVIPHVLFSADHARLPRAEQGEVALSGMPPHLEFVPATVGQVKQLAPAVPGHATEVNPDGSAQEDLCRLDPA